MVKLTEVDLVRCVLLGDEDSSKEMMMKKYAAYSGVPYNSESRELITAFKGPKMRVRRFILCRADEREATCILDTVIERIRGVPFVLVGTQIEKRLSMLIENYGCGEVKYMPMTRITQSRDVRKSGIGASNIEGLDEVFEGAFEVGHKYALEQLRGARRKLMQVQETEPEKPGCIAQ
ncbi:hypothetical protein OSTOST_20772 [Ostertagia ostertagi]